MSSRNFRKLKKLKTFDERFNYLKLEGRVGRVTFGWDRPLNQHFYKSPQWKDVRDYVIVRDNGLDLGVMGYEILDRVLVHHMNPVQIKDLENFDPKILDPEFLITISAGTHRAIHYGYERVVPRLDPERRPGDTRLW